MKSIRKFADTVFTVYVDPVNAENYFVDLESAQYDDKKNHIHQTTVSEK
ncbi:MAG: hypothetical protein LBP53_00800 [Candidatus Peribacteria bacterium]|nr:hypothetical protein [Candidatus Peribacteria bacterium]